MYVAVLVRARFDTGFFAGGGENISSIAYFGFDRGFFLLGREGKHVDCMIVYDECE